MAWLAKGKRGDFPVVVSTQEEATTWVPYEAGICVFGIQNEIVGEVS